ncbi:MAG: hypothetical protein CM15mP4_2760 [Candidatus Neomarinimicrobiota bacterium]|nr:MAG: hypothetical protein CM15mP4_2760 [Candidatus Neomarinimicrobiota bacterium]
MQEVDDEFTFVIEEKSNVMDITEKGRTCCLLTTPKLLLYLIWCIA